MSKSCTKRTLKRNKDKVASGMYPNANEFVREAILRAVERDHLKRQRLNEAIAIGIEQADRGELFDLNLDQINAELDEEEGYVRF